MIRNHSRSSKRSAFTMVELMVVILIIAILVSLVTAAVMKALGKIPEVQTRTEITELATGLQGFMSDYNISDPPPSTLFLNEFAPMSVGGTSAAFLQKVFGKNLTSTDWNGDGVIAPANITWTLQGHQCLVFYLGGIPTAPGLAGYSPQGFSTNNMSPGLVGGKRKGPYFNFIMNRLMPPPATAASLAPTFPVYIDPWQTKTGAFYAAPTTVAGIALGGTPYAYFSSYGINNGYSMTDCSELLYTDVLGQHVAMPYWMGTTGTILQYTYSNTYQIISAGKDGYFGYNPTLYGTAPNPNYWVPASGVTPGWTGADDQANFSSTLLGSGQN